MTWLIVMFLYGIYERQIRFVQRMLQPITDWFREWPI